MSKNIRWGSLLILFISVTSIGKKLLKTTHTEEHSIHINSENAAFDSDLKKSI